MEIKLAKVAVIESELQEHLKKQLRFLERSCKLFDEGEEDEAARIATVLRVLFHDTANKSSISLTRHLSLQDMSLLDTSGTLLAGNMIFDTPLVAIGHGAPGGPKHFAPFESYSVRARWIPCKSWWQQLVFRHQSVIKFSRSRLVTVTANQFGGTHVDASIDADFNDIVKGRLGMTALENGQTILMNDVAAVTLRQIGHEVLRSFLPEYVAPERKLDFGMITMGVAVSKQSTLEPPVGRNELCPCESGIKYKKCHGRPV